MILSGRIAISKSITYENFQNEKLKKQEIVINIGAGDVIGEDMLWLNRGPSYTATVTS